jgi:hypothetical protein
MWASFRQRPEFVTTKRKILPICMYRLCKATFRLVAVKQSMDYYLRNKLTIELRRVFYVIYNYEAATA